MVLLIHDTTLLLLLLPLLLLLLLLLPLLPLLLLALLLLLVRAPLALATALLKTVGLLLVMSVSPSVSLSGAMVLMLVHSSAVPVWESVVRCAAPEAGKPRTLLLLEEEPEAEGVAAAELGTTGFFCPLLEVSTRLLKSPASSSSSSSSAAAVGGLSSMCVSSTTMEKEAATAASPGAE